MYIRYMLAAFLTNGLGAFGLRVLAGTGLGEVDEPLYLSLWYLCGFLIAAAAFLAVRARPAARELVVGALMALCSLGGQLGMALSLSRGIPGFVVFPVATGGGLLFVVAIGTGLFRETITPLGYCGIATGTVALILLALPA